MSNMLPIRDFPLTQNVNAKIDMDVAFKKDLSLEPCSNTVIQRQPYVVSLNVTLKHWMTICGECQKNNVPFL